TGAAAPPSPSRDKGSASRGLPCTATCRCSAARPTAATAGSRNKGFDGSVRPLQSFQLERRGDVLDIDQHAELPGLLEGAARLVLVAAQQVVLAEVELA